MTLAVLFSLFLSTAAADVVMEPPSNCPVGSQGTSGHSGEWCTPNNTCAGDDECTQNGESCRPIGLCIATTEEPCGGMQVDTGTPCTFTKNEVMGRCSSEADCADGVPCVQEQRCARGGGVGGCLGCATTTTATMSGFAAVGGLVLLGVLVPRRRRG